MNVTIAVVYPHRTLDVKILMLQTLLDRSASVHKHVVVPVEVVHRGCAVTPIAWAHILLNDPIGSIPFRVYRLIAPPSAHRHVASIIPPSSVIDTVSLRHKLRDYGFRTDAAYLNNPTLRRGTAGMRSGTRRREPPRAQRRGPLERLPATCHTRANPLPKLRRKASPVTRTSPIQKQRRTRRVGVRHHHGLETPLTDQPGDRFHRTAAPTQNYGHKAARRALATFTVGRRPPDCWTPRADPAVPRPPQSTFVTEGIHASTAWLYLLAFTMPRTLKDMHNANVITVATTTGVNM